MTRISSLVATLLFCASTTIGAATQEKAPEKSLPATESAAPAEAKAPSEAAAQCDELCGFIRTVLKEAPKSFQSLRGDIIGTLPAQYAGKLSLPGLDCIALARLYTCSLPAPKDMAAGEKEYARIQQVIRAAVPKDWKFEEKQGDPELPGHLFLATNPKTGVAVTIELADLREMVGEISLELGIDARGCDYDLCSEFPE
jgi:hypothetical protein